MSILFSYNLPPNATFEIIVAQFGLHLYIGGMIKWKTQIHERELHEIRVLLVEGYSILEIAEKLWRNKSTVYRLFQNNGIDYKQRKFQYVGWKSWEKIFRENGKKKIQLLPHHVHLLRTKRRSLASSHPSKWAEDGDERPVKRSQKTPFIAMSILIILS